MANCVENAIVHADTGTLEPEHFARLSITAAGGFNSYEEAKKHYLARFQRDYISAALSKHGGNISKTAQNLSVSRQGLMKMMESCGLSSPAEN